MCVKFGVHEFTEILTICEDAEIWIIFIELFTADFASVWGQNWIAEIGAL